MPRRRDSVLEALEILRGAEPAISLTHTLAFLYICENEGLNVSELAAVSRVTIATASRTARALTARSAPDSLKPAPGWIESRLNPTDAKSRILFLTPAGRALRERIDLVIRASQPIVQPQAADTPHPPISLRRAS